VEAESFYCGGTRAFPKCNVNIELLACGLNALL
jgi:hypothetical protein